MEDKFRLDYPRKGGSTLRKTLEQAAKVTGFKDEELNETEIPKGFESWVDTYMLLRGGDGVTFRDIEAYENTMGIKMPPIKVTALIAMDRAVGGVINTIMKENNKP